LQPLHPATKFTISSLNINTKSTITANHQQEKLSPILYLCIMRLKKEIKNFIERNLLEENDILRGLAGIFFVVL